MKITVEKIEDLDLMPIGEVIIINRWGGLSTYLNRQNKIFTEWDFSCIRAFFIDEKIENNENLT